MVQRGKTVRKKRQNRTKIQDGGYILDLTAYEINKGHTEDP